MKHLLLIACLLVSQSAFAEFDRVAIDTIILEAQGESLDGQKAVGEVIRNRALKRHQSIESVCMARKQFSCWNDHQEAKNRLKMVSGEVFQRASRAWSESETSNLTKGATHYHNLDVSPYWSKGKLPCVVVGKHKFYNNVR